MIDRMDLTTLGADDLAALVESFRALALRGNRVAFDLFCITERAMLDRHQSTPIAEYTDAELSEMTATMATAVDSARANGGKDEAPGQQFLLYTMTALVNELEKRGL